MSNILKIYMRKIIKSGIWCVLLSFAFVWVSFWYLEKTAYCEIWSKYIKVYLYKEDAQKCATYVQSLDHSIRLIYKDMVTVQQLIDLGYDKDYWLGVKADMQTKIDGFQSMRSNILYRVHLFESNFFDKIKLYMGKYLSPYQEALEIKLENIGNSDMTDFSPSMIEETNQRVISIQNQLIIIENIVSTKNLEELISYIPSYLYLKKEIEWK